MQDVTQILRAIEDGDAQATEDLLPVVYGELRRLASAKMRHEKSNHTLTSTALVHEAYLRLVEANPTAHSPHIEDGRSADFSGPGGWTNRSHFFAAAAEAMRRILIENARRKHRLKHGGEMKRHNLDDVSPVGSQRSAELIALDDALDDLLAHNELAGNLIKLRFFAGLTIPQAAWSLGISESHAKRLWAYARAWLYRQIYAD